MLKRKDRVNKRNSIPRKPKRTPAQKAELTQNVFGGIISALGVGKSVGDLVHSVKSGNYSQNMSAAQEDEYNEAIENKARAIPILGDLVDTIKNSKTTTENTAMWTERAPMIAGIVLLFTVVGLGLKKLFGKKTNYKKY